MSVVQYKNLRHDIKTSTFIICFAFNFVKTYILHRMLYLSCHKQLQITHIKSSNPNKLSTVPKRPRELYPGYRYHNYKLTTACASSSHFGSVRSISSRYRSHNEVPYITFRESPGSRVSATSRPE